MSGDNGKVAFGLFLVLAGSWNAWAALKSGAFPYIFGGTYRAERPLLFWLLIIAPVGLAVGGIVLLASGIAHIHTFLD